MAATKITVNNNGSLKIEGEIELVDKNVLCEIHRKRVYF